MPELAQLPLYYDTRLYYRGENANDSKGIANLTNAGLTPFSAALFKNGFDGGASNTTKWLNYTTSNPFSALLLSAYSISLWVKLTTEVGASQYHFADFSTQLTLNASASSMILQYQFNAGTRRLALTAGATSVVYNVVLGTTNWYHIVGTYKSGGSIKLYMNNAVVVQTSAGADSSTAGSDYISVMTDLGNNAASACSGIVDDIGYFEKELTEKEVGTIFSRSKFSDRTLRPAIFKPGIAR